MIGRGPDRVCHDHCAENQIYRSSSSGCFNKVSVNTNDWKCCEVSLSADINIFIAPADLRAADSPTVIMMMMTEMLSSAAAAQQTN